MHIAVVCRGLGLPGAVSSIALRQARELTRYARITLVSDSFGADATGEPAWAERRLVPMPDFHLLRRLRHVPDEVAFGRGARGVLRSLPSVDFILAHAHSVAYTAARGLGIPVGFFVHGDIFARPKGTYDARLTAFYRWITPRAYAAADVVFVLAPYLAETARGHGARRIEMIPNGIDLHDLGLDEMPPARPRSGPLRMLTVNRLSVEKGIEYLLAACRLLDPHVDYELTIAGTGPLDADLRHAAADLPRVRFMGEVPRASLGPVYGAHDLFVTPTRNEAFGLVVLEALACGLPVVGTDIDALRSVVTEGVNGLLVAPADARALADAIARIAGDEPLRLSLAANAHGSVLPRYGWTAIGDAIADVIRGMQP